MKEINIETWNRKNQYNNFIKYSNPIVALGVDLDVTKLLDYCEENNKSFFSTFLYIITKSINKFDEWKTRILDDKIVVYDNTHPSYIVLRSDESMVTCVTYYESSFKKFHDNSRIDIEKARKDEVLQFNSSSLDYIYVSCMSNINFTSFINPYNFNDKSQSSIPRIAWGKYHKVDNKYMMPINISAHHALVDGIHFSKLINEIENGLDNIKTFLGE